MPAKTDTRVTTLYHAHAGELSPQYIIMSSFMCMPAKGFAFMPTVRYHRRQPKCKPRQAGRPCPTPPLTRPHALLL